MGNIDVVRACLEDAGAYRPSDFAAAEEIEHRYAVIAILPVYSPADV